MDPTTAKTALTTAAKVAGYYVRRGSYSGTTDDRLDRWYVGNHANEFFRPWGSGFRTQREAWESAIESMLALAKGEAV